MKSKIYRIYHFYHDSNPLQFYETIIYYRSGRVRTFDHTKGQSLPATAFHFASTHTRHELRTFRCVCYK